MDKIFKLKNKYLSGLVQWLAIQQLTGKQSRERTRFINLLQIKLKEIEGFYKGLMEKFIEKGKDGKYSTKKDKDGTEVYTFVTKKEEEEYVKEIDDLNDEEFKIELTEINKEMLTEIKKVVLDTDYKFGPKENTPRVEIVKQIRLANEYEEWCQSFEKI